MINVEIESEQVKELVNYLPKSTTMSPGQFSASYIPSYDTLW